MKQDYLRSLDTIEEYQRTMMQANNCSLEVLTLLNTISTERWWSVVLQMSEDIQKQIINLFYGDKKINIEKEIIRLQGLYIAAKISNPVLKICLENEEGTVKRLLPPSTALYHFLKGKGKSKMSELDLFYQVFFHLLIVIRANYVFISNFNRKNTSPIETIKSWYHFSLSNITTSTDNYNQCLMAFESFYNSPEGFLYAYPDKRIVNAMTIILLCKELLELSDGCPNDPKGIYCTLRDEVLSFSTDLANAFPCSDSSDYVGVSKELIDACLHHFFPNVLSDDEKIYDLCDDLESLSEKANFLETKSAKYMPKYLSLTENLYSVFKQESISNLNYLFAILNIGIVTDYNLEKQILCVFRSMPFNSFVQDAYYKFRSNTSIPTKELLFINQPNIDDIDWRACRDRKCFNLDWNFYKMQYLYNRLIAGNYIDEETDIIDFVHVLTGATYKDSNRTMKKVKWIHPHKQSLALFIGELINRDIRRFSWNNYPKVFTLNEADVEFHSSVQYKQAMRSGKYDDLKLAIEETENFSVPKDELI